MSEKEIPFELKELSNETEFSKKYLGIRKKDGEKFAIKAISKKLLNDKSHKRLINNEIYILSHIKNEKVIKYHNYFTDSNYIYLVFEYCNGGDLSNCLKKYIEKYKKSFSQEIVQYIMKQIISGFVYLHSQKIIHRDINLSNFLVQFITEEDKKNLNMMKAKILIADFGFACYLKEGQISEEILGFPLTMEPHILNELFKMKNKIQDKDNELFGYDEKADIWTLGAITYELLMGNSLFNTDNIDEIKKRIDKGEYTIPQCISMEAISFLDSMLKYNPENRLDIKSINNQYFLIKKVSEFHYLSLKNNNGNNIGNNIILDIRKNNMKDLLNIYNIVDHVPEKEIKSNEIINKIKKLNLDDEKEKDEFLNNLFDEMNKKSNFIEPLFAPIELSEDNYYYSFDLVSDIIIKI